jgi:riboflavin kinase/FMN adenylyltransferase
MKIIRGIHNIKSIHRECVLTIGNFDGVHIGHKKILDKVKNISKKLNKPSVVITFEPLPEEFFLGKHFRLSSLREKYFEIEQCGIDYLLVLPFNSKLANLPAENFIKNILVDKLDINYLIVGDDFCFGSDQLKVFNYLKSVSCKFAVEDSNTLGFNNNRISSSWIRKALSGHDLKTVYQLLGRNYSIIGRVMHGNGRGRTFGFPTANLPFRYRVTPLSGVYAVYVHGIDNKNYFGMANVGIRPTINGKESLLEVNILDFDKDIYGKFIRVEFVEHIRDEKKFDSIAELIIQMKEDAKVVRSFFKFKL